VEGFGWSNGVLIWAADMFGQQLQTPDCGNITAADIEQNAKRGLGVRSAMHLSNTDARWVKKFNRGS
jgi:alpha,alpha-trehalase